MFGNLDNRIAQGTDCLEGYTEQLTKDHMQVFMRESLLPVPREQPLGILRPVRRRESVVELFLQSHFRSLPFTRAETCEGPSSARLSVSGYFSPKIRKSRPVAPIDLE